MREAVAEPLVHGLLIRDNQKLMLSLLLNVMVHVFKLIVGEQVAVLGTHLLQVVGCQSEQNEEHDLIPHRRRDLLGVL